MKSVLLRYNEIALKGGNRAWFERRLAKNVETHLLRDLPQLAGKLKIERRNSRVVVRFEGTESSQVARALSRVYGIANFSFTEGMPTDLPGITRTTVDYVERYLQNHGVPASFAIRTRRSEKVLPETSVDIDRIVGGAVREKFPALKVDLKNAELIVDLEIREKESFLSVGKSPGLRGLPVGVNAPTLTLISGGLDSPIAAIQILKRGSPTSFIHFYGTPFVGPEVLTKIEDLVREVNRYSPTPGRLYVVPIGKIQEKIALATNPKLRTLLYRRLMIRIACVVAERMGARALVTGESIGQVASQTIENLACINSVATIPIIRPLVTWDKEQIIEKARELGTFEISVRPAVDCCTLFADRHPAIHADLETILKQEERFPVQEFVDEALKTI